MELRKRPIYALYLNGTDSAVDCGNNNSLKVGETPNSAMAWYLEFKHDAQPGLTSTTMSLRPTHGTIYNNDNTYEQNAVYNSLPTDYFDITISRYDRHILIFQHDSITGTTEIYIDGISKISVTRIDYLASSLTYHFMIGNVFNTDWYKGLIYRIGIFNTILTASQISNLSNKTQKPTDIPGCMMYHDYTMGNATDWSGNGNHGTLQGNASFMEVDYETYYSSYYSTYRRR